MKSIKEGIEQRKFAASCSFQGSFYNSKFDATAKTNSLLDSKEKEATMKFIAEEERQLKKLENKLEAWKRFLCYPMNKFVLSDAFWYARFNLVPDEHSEKTKDIFLTRISRNYVELFLNINGAHKESFFKVELFR